MRTLKGLEAQLRGLDGYQDAQNSGLRGHADSRNVAQQAQVELQHARAELLNAQTEAEKEWRQALSSAADELWKSIQ